jgi:regulator of sigma E protease
MEGLIMTAQIILSLSILVAVHEMGHLLAAKYFGMRVEQFSIGFPPKIWSFTKGGTEYALSAIPLGGYVKISGMIDESLDLEKMKKDPEPWEFRSKPAWQRLIVMLGGIIVNIIMGVIIFICLTYFVGDTYFPNAAVNNSGGIHARELAKEIGLQTGDKIVAINGKAFDDFGDVYNPDALLTENATYTVDRSGSQIEIAIPSNFIENFNDKGKAISFVSPRQSPTVGEIQSGSLADRLKLQAGDKFISLDNQPVYFYDDIERIKEGITSDTLAFSIQRGSEVLNFKEYVGANKTIGFQSKGVEFELAKINYGFGESIALGTQRAFGIVFTQVKAFKKLFSGELSFRKSMSGPIGIAQAYGGNWDWERFWKMTGLLSMVLAFMNLLPIPALDGGHVVFLTYEMVTRRKPSDKFLEIAQKAGMVFLLGLMVFIFANDIIKLF